MTRIIKIENCYGCANALHKQSIYKGDYYLCLIADRKEIDNMHNCSFCPLEIIEDGE